MDSMLGNQSKQSTHEARRTIKKKKKKKELIKTYQDYKMLLFPIKKKERHIKISITLTTVYNIIEHIHSSR